MHHCRLTPHLTTPCPDIAGIDVRVSLPADGGLILTYTLSGALARLRIPAPATPARTDGLWHHTCFEAFVMAEPGPAYREFNLSPSGEWAAYSFHAYRDGGPLVAAPEPAILCRACDVALELEARLPRLALPDGMGLRLGLSAVVEDKDGKKTYWALRHPPGKPDFHHTDAFALQLNRL